MSFWSAGDIEDPKPDSIFEICESQSPERNLHNRATGARDFMYLRFSTSITSGFARHPAQSPRIRQTWSQLNCLAPGFVAC
jgi:hypothetical protein